MLRWTAEPEHEPALAAFAQVAEAWEPIDVVVDAPKLVIENVPFMHGASVEWTVARPQQIAEYTKNLILDGAIPLRQLTIKKIAAELEAHSARRRGATTTRRGCEATSTACSSSSGRVFADIYVP